MGKMQSGKKANLGIMRRLGKINYVVKKNGIQMLCLTEYSIHVQFPTVCQTKLI